MLEALLAWCRAHQLLKVRQRQLADSTPVLAIIRALIRLEVVGATAPRVCAASAPGVSAPDRWSRGVVPGAPAKASQAT